MHSHITEWPDGSEPTPLEEYHVTLAYLGDVADLPDYNTVAKVVNEFANYQPALYAKVSGIGRFGVNDDSPGSPSTCPSTAAISRRCAPSLVAFLEATGIPVRHTHGFTPHITLGYVPQRFRYEPARPSPVGLGYRRHRPGLGQQCDRVPLAGPSRTPCHE